MKKLITAIMPGSIAEELNIKAGDTLLAVNGGNVADVFDYRLAMAAETVEILIQKADGDRWLLEIEKDEDEDIGLVFAGSLMDSVRACANHCVFCFIHQNPRDMRPTVYFKDDDYRLSYLHGNYITLTNMTPADIDRILAHRLSPMNISVHTTNPALRAKMMGSTAAGDSLDFLHRLAQSGIDLGLQVVLCKDFNDGEELDRTIADLGRLIWDGKGAYSLSVVPVGLTCHRDGLAPLLPLSPADCAAAIAQVEAFQRHFLREIGTGFVFCADEMYVRAGLPLPPYESYEGFPQIENGVGMMAAFRHEFYAAFRPQALDPDLLVVTGHGAYPFLTEICRPIGVEVAAVDNKFFGSSVNVAGLLTGSDIIAAFCGKVRGRRLLIPTSMLKADEDVFLDGLTPQDVAAALGADVVPVYPDGEEFAKELMG